MSLGQRLRKRRQALKLTQQELAESLGVTPQHVSAIEGGQRAPSIPFLAKLAEELGVTIDFLVTGKESIITDIIPAIKADKTLNLEARRVLITLVRALRDRADKRD